MLATCTDMVVYVRPLDRGCEALIAVSVRVYVDQRPVRGVMTEGSWRVWGRMSGLLASSLLFLANRERMGAHTSATLLVWLCKFDAMENLGVELGLQITRVLVVTDRLFVSNPTHSLQGRQYPGRGLRRRVQGCALPAS